VPELPAVDARPTTELIRNVSDIIVHLSPPLNRGPAHSVVEIEATPTDSAGSSFGDHFDISPIHTALGRSNHDRGARNDIYTIGFYVRGCGHLIGNFEDKQLIRSIDSPNAPLSEGDHPSVGLAYLPGRGRGEREPLNLHKIVVR